ncbi:PIN domain-containing protein [Micromonospora arborensis]|uniref:PIN domain-containing protein n=1 Tax=Micromonospora arborensis TaxID=2116518 RepID=UPI0033CE9C01
MILEQAHRRNSASPVSTPDERGRFAPAMLPEVFPVVVDANALRDDLLRVAAGKGRTLMLNAANSGVLRLFCAPHVVEEVEQHLEEWSAQKRLEPPAVRAAWRGYVAPLLRCVQVPDGLTTVVEQRRLGFLAQRSHVGDYCDPDDVPTATLAILLNAALLSKDRAPLRAVYGEMHDHLAHAQRLNELRAVGDLGPLGGLIGALNALLGVAVDGLFHGAFATARRVPWPWLVVGALATAGTIRYLVAPETRHRLQTVLGMSLSSVSAAVAEVLAHREDAKRQFATLLPVQPGWHEITEHRNPAATLTRACLHHLAHSPQSDLSAKELTELLWRTGDVAAGEARVRSTLRGMAAFSEPGRGRFQVGSVVSPPGVA